MILITYAPVRKEKKVNKKEVMKYLSKAGYLKLIKFGWFCSSTFCIEMR